MLQYFNYIIRVYVLAHAPNSGFKRAVDTNLPSIASLRVHETKLSSFTDTLSSLAYLPAIQIEGLFGLAFVIATPQSQCTAYSSRTNRRHILLLQR